MTVSVTDVNDNSPQFNQPTYTFSVDEEKDNEFVGTIDVSFYHTVLF